MMSFDADKARPVFAAYDEAHLRFRAKQAEYWSKWPHVSSELLDELERAQAEYLAAKDARDEMIPTVYLDDSEDDG